MEKIFSKGKLFELVHTTQADGRIFESARRAPGVRVIIADMEAQKVLLTREFRQELKGWDYRLPGGKVFDTLAAYEKFRSGGKDIMPVATAKAQAEAAEEAGMVIDDVQFFKKSTLGATVEWDLYVFQATKWLAHADGQSLEEGEQVEHVGWYTFMDVGNMILAGSMQEERIALILLQWLAQQKLAANQG